MTKTATRKKNPGGAPTKYRAEHCDTVVKLGKKGFSRCEMAVGMGVTRETLNNWADKHPKFLAALTRADEASQMWWERKGRNNLNAKSFQAQVWKKTMEARFRQDYTTIEVRQNVEMSHEEWLNAVDGDDDST